MPTLISQNKGGDSPEAPRVRFDQLKLIYPPRPRGAIPPSSLGRYSGFVAQYKYNDTRNLTYLAPDGRVFLFNRHKEPHRAYRPSAAMIRSIQALGLPLGYFHVLDGGILNRTAGIKDRLVLWDILVYRSEYLLGTTYWYRYHLLNRLLGHPTRPEGETGDQIALRVNSQVWLAPIFRAHLEERYRDLIHLDEVEGLVLKDPGGKLEQGLREENNGSWQTRVRKPSAHYAF